MRKKKRARAGRKKLTSAMRPAFFHDKGARERAKVFRRSRSFASALESKQQKPMILYVVL